MYLKTHIKYFMCDAAFNLYNILQRCILLPPLKSWRSRSSEGLNSSVVTSCFSEVMEIGTQTVDSEPALLTIMFYTA